MKGIDLFTNPFPICVGMNREIGTDCRHKKTVPHMRGDEPLMEHMTREEHDRSPYAWG